MRSRSMFSAVVRVWFRLGPMEWVEMLALGWHAPGTHPGHGHHV